MRLILASILFSAGILHASMIVIPGTAVSQVGGGAIAFGQTFVLPDPTSDDVFSSFDFIFQGTGTFHALVYQWGVDPNSASGAPVGPALYDSGPLAAPEVMIQKTFDTGGILLNPSLAYVAFISSPDLAGYSFFYNTGNPYADGRAMQTSDANLFAPGSWSATGALIDSTLVARFTTAENPEPATLFTFAAGIGLLIVIPRRRTRG